MFVVTEPLILPADVLVRPVSELPESIRQLFNYEEGDYAITRPRTRQPSSIVDARAADFLGQFHQPTTLVQAVIRFSQAHNLDPQEILTEVFPLVQKFVQAH